MPIPYVFTSTILSPVPVVPGLPRPRAYDPMPHGVDSDKFSGRKLDAYARAFYLMKKQASPYLAEPSTSPLLQRLIITFDDASCLTLEQVLCGWPISGCGFWRKKLGLPIYSPAKRVRNAPDCNGHISPTPLRLFIRVAGNNKQRVWRVCADGLPDSYCVFCPDGDQWFIHAAHLGQLILSACPEHLNEFLRLA